MTKRRMAFVAVLCSTVLLGVSNCLSVDSEPEANTDPRLGQAIELRYQIGRLKLRSMEGGDPNQPPIVFIHGTPGSWGFFESYLSAPELQDKARLIAIDRPGWGESQISGEAEATLREQSSLLGDWLCKLAENSPNNKLVIVGHSYGATLTPRLAMDNPDCVSAMLLLAGASDPRLTSPRWYNQLANVPPFSWLAGTLNVGLRQSNREMMRVQSELELMRPMWKDLDLPTTVIQGEQDMLVHKDNADFIEDKLAHIPVKVIRMEEEGHMIVRTHRDMVVAEIVSLL